MSAISQRHEGAAERMAVDRAADLHRPRVPKYAAEFGMTT
jgi:hypothetical protein